MSEYGLGDDRHRPIVRSPAVGRGRSFRSIWISDLHLGTRRCRAGELLEFLNHHEADNLYLVGDIVDGWVTGPPWHWSREQGAVVQTITSWHRRGVRVVFLPGNHDEVSIDLAHALLGPLPIASQLIHRTAEGRRMLVIHGHQFDGSLNPNRWMSILGAQAYHQALRIDRWYSDEGLQAAPRRRRAGILRQAAPAQGGALSDRFHRSRRRANRARASGRRSHLRPYPLPGAAPDRPDHLHQ